jgi:hypothetical protein
MTFVTLEVFEILMLVNANRAQAAGNTRMAASKFRSLIATRNFALVRSP